MMKNQRTRLGVNIDHVATVRQARRGSIPDPVEAALEAIRGGATGITAHLREDRRHIQEHDLMRLKRKIRVPLNMEMAATPGLLRVAKRIRPEWVCLVPERRAELTTEGGLDVIRQGRVLKQVIALLQAAKIRVSLFIAPSLQMVMQSVHLQADAIEIHTGHYAEVFPKNVSQRKKELIKIERSATLGAELGLIVNAGHGLDYENVGSLTKIFPFHEYNIGFSIVAHALKVGMTQAVKEMKETIDSSCVGS